MPHIYAKNEDDGFFTQDFNTAHDRLLQIDLWCCRDLGQLSEVPGLVYVEQDRATRLFLYRGDIQVERNHYSPDAQYIVTYFVAGIDVCIDQLTKHSDQVSFEFHRLNYAPTYWVPEDVVCTRNRGLTRNPQSGVARADVTRKANLADDITRFGLQPT